MFNSCAGNKMLEAWYKFLVGLSALILGSAPEGGWKRTLHAPNLARNTLHINAEWEPPSSVICIIKNMQRSGKCKTDLRAGFGCEVILFFSSLLLFLYLNLFAAGERCWFNGLVIWKSSTSINADS